MITDLIDIFIHAHSSSINYFLSLLIYTSTIPLALLLFIISFIYRNKTEFLKIMFFIYCILIPLYIFYSICYILKIEFIFFTSLGYYLGGIICILLLSTDCFLLRYVIHKFKLNDEVIIKKYKEENGELFKENNLLKLRLNYVESKLRRLEK